MSSDVLLDTHRWLDLATEMVRAARAEQARATRAYLAALVRGVFPRARALMVHLPHLDGGTYRIDPQVIVGSFDDPFNPEILYDADNEDSYSDTIVDAWHDLYDELASVIEDLIGLTGVRDWRWCDADGAYRQLDLPQEHTPKVRDLVAAETTLAALHHQQPAGGEYE